MVRLKSDKFHRNWMGCNVRAEINRKLKVKLLEFSCDQVIRLMTLKSLGARAESQAYQRRDFSCKCGKTYMSYPAAYTHVKNKHNLEKEFVETIQRPKRELLRKGRPKHRKLQDQSVQLMKLTLIQKTILKMYSRLEGNFDKIILQDNSQRNSDQFWSRFQAMCDYKNGLLSQFDLEGSSQIEQFIQLLSKDFSTEIAVRVRLVCLILAGMEGLEQLSYRQGILSDLNIWLGDNKINEIILNAYQEWERLNESQEKDSL